MGPVDVRIDLFRFLVKCRTMRLNQALSVLSLSLGFFCARVCVCRAVNYGLFLCCVNFVICVFCLLVVFGRFSVLVQDLVIDWKDSCLK